MTAMPPIRSLVLAAAAFCLAAPAQKKTWTDAEVMKVHRSAILIDSHNDVPMRTLEGLDFTRRASSGHTDLVRMREGGMTAQFFAAYVAPTTMEGNHSAHRALAMIDSVREDIAKRAPRDFLFATSAADILKAKKQGRIAVLIGIEGGYAIEDDPRLLRDYYALGVRYMTLTHNRNTSWAGSSGEKDNKGLNELGRRVIAEMNRLGMMVDVAHVSDRTFADALEASRTPIFSSHSSCRALTNVARNLSDDMIRALAKRGGVVQINFACDFLSQKSADSSPFNDPQLMAKVQKSLESITDPAERRAALRKLMNEAEKRMVPATIDDVVANIDHVRQVAGIQAVGLGSDYDGISCVPQGLEDVSKWPNLTRRLLEKGYTPADIRAIYGGNLLRFMREVEKAATSGASR